MRNIAIIMLILFLVGHLLLKDKTEFDIFVIVLVLFNIWNQLIDNNKK